jgi:hypothetical protein
MSHCSSVLIPAAMLWFAGIEIATRGRPASAVSGKNRKNKSNRIVVPGSDGKTVAERTDDFIKMKSGNLELEA